MPDRLTGFASGDKTPSLGSDAGDNGRSAQQGDGARPPVSRDSAAPPSVKLGERAIPVIRGPVVRPDDARVDPEPIHDNHFRVGADGIRPVFFDPSTKREFVADRHGATVEAGR